MSWFSTLTPSEPELLDMLKLLYGPDWFRIPNRKWEDLWRLRRGQLNHALGMRHFEMRKRQRGILHPIGFWVQTGTQPALTNIAHASSHTSPTADSQQYVYDSDGSMKHDLDAVTAATIVYTQLTTQTDDANDHTSEWWPDHPETNEGLNWDIRYHSQSMNLISGTGNATSNNFRFSAGANRTSGTWYLLDDVSNDHADATRDGCMGGRRPNGVAKSPAVGLHNYVATVEIRTTGSGAAVASHAYDLDLEGT